MNNKTNNRRYHWMLLAGLLSFGLTTAVAQEDESDEEQVFELSPFEVDTSSDRGYYAANTISGSRINIALQDMPMPIEVITSEFIEDTGSQDLREALRMSSGILLTTQNPIDGIDGVPGGVHNPEGATANLTDTTIKVRGFITDSTLRKGFRRQHGSDSINIDRVEVVRGPAALLYGIGNFGGIVNYLPKRPLTFQQTTLAATVGTDMNMRGTLDTTAPLNDQLAYRVTAAAESGDHWTDWQSHEKFFISPVLQWTPDDKTKVTLDIELGTEETNGIGFQRMRARATDLDPTQVITQPNRLQMAGFAIFDGVDPRTARLSGPDTYITTDSSNILFEVERNLLPGLDLMVGYNKASADVEKRDIINNAYVSARGPANLRGTIKIDPFTDRDGTPIYSSDGAIADNPVVTDGILTYMWQDQEINQERDEYKIELNYKVDLFKDSRWLGQSHMFLLGLSDLTATKSTKAWVTDGQNQNSSLYRDPNDYSPIRFGVGILNDTDDDDATNPDGIAGFPDLLQTERRDTEAGNRGYYGVWQGRFLNDRITTIVGVREDNNDQSITNYEYNTDGTENEGLRSTDTPEGISEMTYQYGISVELFDGVSVFALQSDGLEPNFDGVRDGWNNPIAGKKAKSEEIGLKLNLLEGKIAATISAYNITVVGPSSRVWYAPAPGKGNYDPTKPTTYDIYDPNIGIVETNSPTFQRHEALYNAAVAAGDVEEVTDASGAIIHRYLTVLDANGNDTAGAAFMDAMYADGYNDWGWFGWPFNGSDDYPNTEANNASLDWASGATEFEASLISEEESEGFEFQVLLSPTDNWQIYMSYANTKRRLVNQGAYPKYPYPQDRWAVWYFPNGGFGLNGSTLEEAYDDPTDTSTFTGGPTSRNGMQLDDTPEHDFSLWTSYDFKDGPLEGLKAGLGAYYQSEREYLSGFTFGGDRITDSESGELITLYTQTKLQFSGMLRYDFEWNENPAWVQLNVENLTNDRDIYGFVYEPGRSFRLQAGITF